MDRQFSVRLPAELATRIERMAKRTGTRRSEVVRAALKHYLSGSSVRVSTRPIRLVRDLLGTVESGLPDLGQRHREYLLRRLRRAR